MKQLGIWEPVSGIFNLSKEFEFLVKSQTLKSAIESACLLLRVDDILSGISKKKDKQQAQPQPEMDEETSHHQD